MIFCFVLVLVCFVLIRVRENDCFRFRWGGLLSMEGQGAARPRVYGIMVWHGYEYRTSTYLPFKYMVVCITHHLSLGFLCVPIY